MGMPARSDIQIFPISYTTGTLDSSTDEIAIPDGTTLISVHADQAYQVAINDGTTLDLAASNSNVYPANYVSYFPVNRNRRAAAVSIHIERLSSDGTYYVNFSK